MLTGLALNEKMTISTMGAYRKTKNSRPYRDSAILLGVRRDISALPDRFGHVCKGLTAGHGTHVHHQQAQYGRHDHHAERRAKGPVARRQELLLDQVAYH